MPARRWPRLTAGLNPIVVQARPVVLEVGHDDRAAVLAALVGLPLGAADAVGVASQLRAVPSSEAVTMRVPSGLKLTASRPAESPLSSARLCPVVASQTRAVLSRDAVRRRLPIGLEVTERTSAERKPALLPSPDPTAQDRHLQAWRRSQFRSAPRSVVSRLETVRHEPRSLSEPPNDG